MSIGIFIIMLPFILALSFFFLGTFFMFYFALSELYERRKYRKLAEKILNETKR